MSRFTQFDSNYSPKRILLIKPSAVGDVVHALPILNLLRTRWPKAHIAWLVTPACAGILEGHAQLDQIIRFERKALARSWRSMKGITSLFNFAKALRAEKFDLVIDLQGLFRSGWMAWQTRAPVRIGLGDAREMAGLFYTHRVAVETKEQHAIERYLSVAEALGCGREPVRYVFPTNDEDRTRVAALLPDVERYAVLLPGTNWMTKRWPVEKFAALIEPLRERFGLTSVVAGGPDVIELAKHIPGAIDLAGKTSLRELVALLEKASLVIANDSGPMHIASALGRPLVTAFGPTSPVRTGPHQRMDTVIRLDLPCSPCYSRQCSHCSCLRWLEIEPVLKLADEQIRVTKPESNAEVRMQNAE